MPPFTLRWGILATGSIAEVFSKDLLTNPAILNVTDVQHKITAVTSSRRLEKRRSASDPACIPSEYRVIKGNADNEVAVKVVPNVIPKDPGRDDWGHGFFWEVDEAVRCIRDGKTESSTMPLEESIAVMDVMEEALRQGGVAYPELITTHDFDTDSPLNTGKA